MRRNKLVIANVALGLSLFVVLTYAVGLTLGIGTSRVIERFNTRLWEPLTDKYLPGSVLDDYEEKACPQNDVFALGFFGQSNATNTVYPTAPGPFPENLLQFDWKSQKCFTYKEPLLGADFELGNSVTYAAIDFAEHTDQTVVVIPFGFGPSSVLTWAYGQGALLHDLVLDRIKSNGFSPQVFLWHQGETDAAMRGVDAVDVARTGYFRRPDMRFDYTPYREGLTKDLYRDALNAVVRRTLTAFPDTRFGIALASIAPCLGRHQIWEPVRAAQQEVALSNPSTFISADGDMITGDANRHDTCHFSAEGAKRISQEYYDSIVALDAFNVIDSSVNVSAAD
jgi:hypothetical protein